MTAPTQPPDKCPAMLEPEPPNAPDTCPACGARKRIDSGEFVHYVCGVCYWRAGQKVVSDLYDDHVAAIALRAERDDLQAMYQRAWTEIGELRAERDAARARAEIAVAFNLRMVNKLRIETDKRPIALPGAPYLLDELIEQLYRTERECAALTARLVKLQAVCDAAIEWRANVERHSNPNWISVADLIQAVDEYSAALASGAVVEGEVTK